MIREVVSSDAVDLNLVFTSKSTSSNRNFADFTSSKANRPNIAPDDTSSSIQPPEKRRSGQMGT